MKKLMAIVLMMMVAMVAFGEVLETEMAVEFGFAPQYASSNVLEMDGSFYGSQTFDNDIGYVKFEFESVLLKYIYFGGGVKTYIQGTESAVNFAPFQLDSMFNGGLQYKGIKLGWRHFCGHAVRPSGWRFPEQGFADTFYDEFYVRLEHKF